MCHSNDPSLLVGIGQTTNKVENWERDVKRKVRMVTTVREDGIYGERSMYGELIERTSLS
jgi:hypothetical protein